MTNPACKRFLNHLLQYDRKLLNLSSFFPKVTAIIDKYPTNRRKRDLDTLLSLLGSDTGSMALGLLEKVKSFVELGEPCLVALLQYKLYWIYDVIGPILRDQMKRYFS